MRGQEWIGRFVVLAALALGGCGSGGNGSGPVADGLTIQPASPSGNQQLGTVGQSLANPLRVLVTRDGTPESSASVIWADNTAGASFSPATALTDGAGLATTSWTLGTTAGVRTATASLPGGNSTRLTATALADGPAAIAFLTGAGVSRAITSTVTLQAGVSDRFGNPVSAAEVTWAVTSGDATLSAASSFSDAQGKAAVLLTLGRTIGTVTVQAAVIGAPLTATAAVTATPPVAQMDTVQLTITGGARFSPALLTVPANTTVLFRWVSGTHDVNSFGAPVFPSISPTISAPASRSVTFTTPGTYQFFCSVHGSETDGMRGTIVVQ